jgi:hypothetical protein
VKGIPYLVKVRVRVRVRARARVRGHPVRRAAADHAQQLLARSGGDTGGDVGGDIAEI